MIRPLAVKVAERVTVAAWMAAAETWGGMAEWVVAVEADNEKQQMQRKSPSIAVVALGNSDCALWNRHHSDPRCVQSWSTAQSP